jgi:hypothetical protein
MNYLTNLSKALENICLNINNQIASIITKGQEMEDKANETNKGETNDDNN